MTRRYWIIYILAFTTLACGISAPGALLPLPTATASLIAKSVNSVNTDTPTHTPRYGEVTAFRLNLRDAPDYNAPADGAGLVRGDRVVILATVGNWYHVKTEDGRRGYVHARYIWGTVQP